jgi:hypothetical protein
LYTRGCPLAISTGAILAILRPFSVPRVFDFFSFFFFFIRSSTEMTCRKMLPAESAAFIDIKVNLVEKPFMGSRNK